MNKFYTFFCIIGIAMLLVSNSMNPPDAHTGAPGELFCANCHSANGNTLAGTISVEGFPASITPNETYTLTVVNRNTNDGGIKAGFQITILGPLNTKAGELSMPSDSSALSMLSGRQYFEHHPARFYPDSNVVKWTVLWTAPSMDPGSIITWYANGIIANGNLKETGDKTISAKGTGAIVLAATDNPEVVTAAVYPNPGAGLIHIHLPDQSQPSAQVRFFDVSGKLVSEKHMIDGVINSTGIPSGFYIILIQQDEKTCLARWTKS